MKKIWGLFNAQDRWRLENGEKFDPENLHPVVLNSSRREYVMGIQKDGDEDAVVVGSYVRPAQRNAARSFAMMVLNEKKDWTRPDLDTKVIACLGAPACNACMGEQLPAMGFASEWRVNPFLDDNKLTAGRLLDSYDPESDMTIDKHLFAEITDETDPVRIQTELARRCVALFGPPHDVFTSEVYPVYQRVFGRTTE